MISDRHYPPGVLERLQETLFDMLVQMAQYGLVTIGGFLYFCA